MTSAARQQRGGLHTAHAAPAPHVSEIIVMGVNAAILTVRGNEPVVAVVSGTGADGFAEDGLPGGAFSPSRHASLEESLRSWVRQQTGLDIGTVRQLCTLADPPDADAHPMAFSVCYMALVADDQGRDGSGAAWRSWYTYFPWEDWRKGKPACLGETIEPPLRAWAAASGGSDRSRRVRICFGLDGAAWDEEKVLERFDLLCEAGLAAGNGDDAAPGLPRGMPGNHARVLASAIGELRRAIKWRPVIFELMPDLFTLFELQKTVEAILGPHLHKQNFRRLVEGVGLVEPTGEFRSRTGGRPAQLYRFRRDVVLEHPAPGVRLKPGRV
ncbi:MAG TPA: NAD regulator [Hyphomicrobiaceae bacterium]|jgi:hypothetical protein|nr:NAD regulator [Hyphomicrobiaceae bacterium]